jgi:hypothetical protein
MAQTTTPTPKYPAQNNSYQTTQHDRFLYDAEFLSREDIINGRNPSVGTLLPRNSFFEVRHTQIFH